jgi:hypothetical protein
MIGFFLSVDAAKHLGQVDPKTGKAKRTGGTPHQGVLTTHNTFTRCSLNPLSPSTTLSLAEPAAFSTTSSSRKRPAVRTPGATRKEGCHVEHPCHFPGETLAGGAFVSAGPSHSRNNPACSPFRPMALTRSSSRSGKLCRPRRSTQPDCDTAGAATRQQDDPRCKCPSPAQWCRSPAEEEIAQSSARFRSRLSFHSFSLPSPLVCSFQATSAGGGVAS